MLFIEQVRYAAGNREQKGKREKIAAQEKSIKNNGMSEKRKGD